MISVTEGTQTGSLQEGHRIVRDVDVTMEAEVREMPPLLERGH